MIPVDTLTVFIMVALLYLVLPLNTWFALAVQRSLQVDLWCIGGILAGLGILLISLRGQVPDLLTYLGANSAVVLSFMLRIKSLHLDLEKPDNNGFIATFFIGYVVIYVPLFVLDLEAALGIWARLGMLLANIWLVALLIRVALAERSRNAAAMAAVYGLVALTVLLLLVKLSTGELTISQPLIGPEIQMSAVAIAIASIVGHFSYMGLVLERSGRAQAVVAIDNARIEAARNKSRELAALDRRRSLGLIASSLSHELTQPLTAISITTQVAQRTLRERELDPAGMTHLLDKIVFNIKRASQVIDQIRGFVRPSESKPSTFDVRETVEHVLHLLRQDFFKKGIKVLVNKPGTSLLLRGDQVELSQVLLHVLRNAVEASTDLSAPRIDICLTTTGETIIIEIQDKGPGLTEEALLKVGTPFFTTKTDSLGLGLAISRQILSLRGGELSVVNLPEGGACARICLPLASDDTSHPGAAGDVV